MTKNTKRKLYYQKYLPGDIITWSYDSIDEIILIKLVTGVVGLFGSFRYETVDLELGCSLDHRYYGDRTNILVSNTDIICKKVCKFSGECDLCNFKPSTRPDLMNSFSLEIK